MRKVTVLIALLMELFVCGQTINKANHGFCNSASKDTKIIQSASALSVNAIITNVNCIGANTGIINANIVVGGKAPYSYSWSNGATSSTIQNLASGVYVLIVTDANGLKDTTRYAVQQLSNLFVGFNTNSDTLTTTNPTLTFTNLTTGQNNLSWNFGDGSPLTNNHNPTHTYSGAGIFTIELTANDINCSEKVQKTLVILNPTGISGKEINDRVSIYKFESDAIVKFNLNEIKKTTITVFDLTGRIVNTKTCMASTETEIIELGEASGIYIVQVQFGNEAIVKKLVK